MSLQSVKKEFDKKGFDFEIKVMDDDTSTVELAAEALSVEPGRIAKTLIFKSKEEEFVIVVAKGDAKVDNKKFKSEFNFKPRFLDYSLVEEVTGHPAGGVCPFGLKNEIPIFLDVSLKIYDHVFPAAGTKNSAVKISPDELEFATGGKWVDVCKE